MTRLAQLAHLEAADNTFRRLSAMVLGAGRWTQVIAACVCAQDSLTALRRRHSMAALQLNLRTFTNFTQHQSHSVAIVCISRPRSVICNMISVGTLSVSTIRRICSTAALLNLSMFKQVFIIVRCHRL